MKRLTLRNGVRIDQLALGTFRAKPEDTVQAVTAAIDAGYRHIDTAAVYGNEEQVGEGIRQSNIPRANIFVTTKLWNTDQGYDSTIAAFNDSLKKLGMDYVDLYLIHWPKDPIKVADTWRAIEDLYLAGKIRAIGVSNFNIHHLLLLFQTCRIIPMVNQVECHVGLQNNVLYDFCMKFEIFLEAYAPLMSHKISDLLENEMMASIAKKHNATIPQIAIAWLMKRDIIALPKSITPSRIQENYEAINIELDKEDMDLIADYKGGNRIFIEPDNTWF